MIDAVPGVDYRFRDPELLKQALTHKSVGPRNYERLEFLGDSILNVVVSMRLFDWFPESSEGDLTRMRARIVRGRTLGEIAKNLSLGQFLNLGSSEMKSGGSRRASILADAFEALLGSIYLDGGFSACQEVIHSLCDPLIKNLPPAEQLKDPKTRLQEWLQGRARPLPIYKLDYEEGADHAKKFFVICLLGDEDLKVSADGKSLRKAEQAAATEMMRILTNESRAVS